MMRFAVLILTCAFAALLPSCQAHTPESKTKLNLILVTIDTLRADRVGSYGGPKDLTPNLDKLSARGLTFLDTTAHVPLTVPSHASMMTGLYPNRLGVRDNGGFPLRPEFKTLAEVLSEAGYGTAGFVGSYVLNRRTGISQGFESFGDRFAIGAVNLLPSMLERPAPEVAAEAVEWLATASEPFFLWVHFYDPHAPYEAPPAFRDQWPNQPYDAEVATTDWALGEILRGVSENVSQKTLYVVTSDHGESLGEHGEPEHGFFLYDATLKVPLVMVGPGLPVGTTFSEQVRHIDIVPTLLALLGLPPSEEIDGENLLPFIEGERRKTIPVSYAETAYGHLHFGSSELRSVRSGTWKYVEAPKAELYHLNVDPGETQNRLEEKGDMVLDLTRELVEIGKATVNPETMPIDSGTAEQLRSLGYMGGGVPASGTEGDDPKDRIRDYVAYISNFNEALQAFEGGDGKRAAAMFLDLVEKFPSSFDAHQYLGRALFSQGRYDSALTAYTKAIRLSPQRATLYMDVALAMAAKREFDRAFVSIQQCKDAEPDFFDCYLVEGIIARDAGDDSRAVAAFDRALSLNAEVAMAEFHLGDIAAQRGDREEAGARYRRALEIDPLYREARTALNRLESTH